MRQANPAFIPRNHRVEHALAQAVQHSDLGPFNELLSVVLWPFEEQPGSETYSDVPPKDGPIFRTFCGT